MNNPYRFVFLDGIRGFAAIAIVLYHFTSFGGRFGRQFTSASLAVDLFFCLSGFIISWTYHQKLLDGMRPWTYFKNRLIRLYPMFLMGIVMGAVTVFIKYLDSQTSYTLEEIATAGFLNALYLPYFGQGSIQLFLGANQNQLFPINGVSWSLFFELIANVLFVFTIRFSRRLLMVTTLFLGVWFLVSSLVYGTPAGWGIHNFFGGFPRVGFSFMVGVLIFKYFDPSHIPTGTNAWLIGIVLFLMLAIPPFQHWIFYYIIAVIALVPPLVWLGAKVRIDHFMSKRVMNYLGWISYPIYCLHGPVLSLFSSLNPSIQHYYSSMAMALGLLTLLAHLSAKYIDEPVRRWLSLRYKEARYTPVGIGRQRKALLRYVR
jgi:peptidoglycan/LPS O-acetylase OafA/YrhL